MVQVWVGLFYCFFVVVVLVGWFWLGLGFFSPPVKTVIHHSEAYCKCVCNFKSCVYEVKVEEILGFCY